MSLDPQFLTGAGMLESASMTPVPKHAPIDESLSKRELGLLRRMRKARREAMTSTQPAIVTVYINEQGEIDRWFVSMRPEG